MANRHLARRNAESEDHHPNSPTKSIEATTRICLAPVVPERQRERAGGWQVRHREGVKDDAQVAEIRLSTGQREANDAWRVTWLKLLLYTGSMPRQKLPSTGEMRRFVQDWASRFGAENPDESLEPAQLKAVYQGWAAVQWVEQHGQPVDSEALASVLSGVRVKAGNSRDKRLWRERILYVGPLGGHYRLPSKVWQWVLRAGAEAGHFPAVVGPDAALAQEAPPAAQPYLITLANKPSVLIDRATRGPDGWNDTTLQYREVFEDGLVLNYFEENAGTETLRQQLMTLDPRTSDVWRLLTAKALEHDRDDLFTPITIKPGELARALGLKPHPNGSVRPKDLLRCTQSLFHLERL